MKVLFVDDEPEVLSGLKRMLHGHRSEITTFVANDGPGALDLLENNDIEIIVSDMRMPKMDGAQLLEEVRSRHPKIIRIILSGHADKSNTIKSVKPAHQFLAKPVNQRTLLDVLMRAKAMMEVMNNESLAYLLSKVESLPSLPHIYKKLTDEIESDQASLEKIGQIIEEDMGMTATILKVVNSAFFGIPRRISKPAQAASLLGMDAIKSLVLSYQLFHSFDLSKAINISFEKLWKHSITTANFSKIIAQDAGFDKETVDEAFFAGMLHDVGKLPLYSISNKLYSKVLVKVREHDMLLADVEQEILGTTHAEAGGYLMGLWGMPEPVIMAIAYHHRPLKMPETAMSILTAVHVANVFEHDLVVINKNYARPVMDNAYLAKINVLERVPHWLKLCKEMVSSAR